MNEVNLFCQDQNSVPKSKAGRIPTNNLKSRNSTRNKSVDFRHLQKSYEYTSTEVLNKISTPNFAQDEFNLQIFSL